MGKPSVAKPRSGDIWDYPYLWQWQHEGLETEGRKSRPAAFVTVMPGQGGSTNLFILPITSSPPQDRIAIEVPQIERRRAGLDDMPLWVVIDEYNHDLLDAPTISIPMRVSEHSAGLFIDACWKAS